MFRRPFRRLLLVIFVAALLAAPAAAVLPGRGVEIPPVPVLSRFEGTGGASLGRDCGYSEPLPGSPARSLWLFCDTPVYVRARSATGRLTWHLRRFIGGSTAAQGPSTRGRVPGKLAELDSPGSASPVGQPSGPPGTSDLAPPGGAPEPFLPQPAGLLTPSGLPCDLAHGAYAVSWITGAARIPSSPDLLITYNNYCVLTSPAPAFVPEGFGLVQYNPAANVLSNQATVFTSIGLAGPDPAELLGSPVFDGRYLYLFGPNCTNPGAGKCSAGRIFTARVQATPLAWMNPVSYTWWAGNHLDAWTFDPSQAASIVPGARPSAVSVQDFSAVGHGLVLIEQNDIDGRFTVYQARSPAGAWTRITSGRVPCRTGRGYANFCRAIIGHPELSTRTRLFLSYFNPAASVFGHVMAQPIPW